MCIRDRHFGVSNFSPSQFDLINDAFPIITNQVEISLNQTRAFTDGTLDQMMLKRLQPMAYSVLGNYFGKKSVENSRIKKILTILCEKYNADENQIPVSYTHLDVYKRQPYYRRSTRDFLRLKVKKQKFLQL